MPARRPLEKVWRVADGGRGDVAKA
jgi:hypothetical protein